MRLGRLLGLALLLSAGATAGARAASSLVVCTEASPDFLNAQLSTANTSFDVSEQVMDRLVEMKIGGSALQPGLAQSWTISPDGLTYTFRLRHGVKWQSNAMFKPTRDFNADDVVFSFQRMMDKANPFYKSANGNFPEFIDLVEPSLESVAKTDDYTVVMKLKKPLAPLLPSLSVQSFSIVSAQYAQALLKAGKPGLLDQDLIGTGPFSFVQYAKDSVVRFRAFPGFWGAQGNAQPDRVAKVDNLIFAITPDPSVRYAKLRANECQIARYPNPADLPAMRANPNLKVLEAPIAGTNYIYFRTDKKPFDDVRVRRALAMAIDMPDLVTDVFQGSGTPAASLVPPSLWGHDAALKPYKLRSGGGEKAADGGRLSERVLDRPLGDPGGARLYAERPARGGDDPVGLGQDRRPCADRDLRMGRISQARPRRRGAGGDARRHLGLSGSERDSSWVYLQFSRQRHALVQQDLHRRGRAGERRQRPGRACQALRAGG